MKKLFCLFFSLQQLLFASDPLIFIVNQGENQVEVYDAVNETFLPPITYGGFNLGYGNVVISNDLSKIYVTNYFGNFISVFDASTYAHIGDFGSAPELQAPEELAFSLDGSKLYVSNFLATNEESVAVYDIQATGLGVFSHHFGGSIVNPTASTASLALNGDRSKLYLVSADFLSSKVSVFDLSSPTPTLLGEFTDPSLDSPLGAFYDMIEDKLYLTNYTSNNISVFNIDPATGLGTFSALFGSPANLQGPEDLVFSEDRTKIYVGNDADFLTEYTIDGTFIRQIFAPSNIALLTGLGVNFVQLPLPDSFFTKASASTIYDNFFTGTCLYNELSWTFSDPDKVLDYQILKKDGNSFNLLAIIHPGQPLRFIDSDIKKGKTYEYKIVAVLANSFAEQLVTGVKK